MESFKINNEMFEEFKKSVSPYLTDIEKIEYKNSNKSNVSKKDRPTSILIVHISNKEEYKKLNLDPEKNNWDDNFPYTGEIKSIWNSLLRKYKTLDSYDTKIGYVFFRCFETDEKYKIAYNSKNEIQAKLEKCSLPKISHIFCSTEMVFSIVLENEKDYKKYERFSIEKIKAVILQILNSKCVGMKFNFSADDFKCKLVNAEKEGKNLYWLLRED